MSLLNSNTDQIPKIFIKDLSCLYYLETLVLSPPLGARQAKLCLSSVDHTIPCLPQLCCEGF